ncbi:hypothetical protein [Enterococcus rivorum]|uniref:hypothetical protein n=1 Tax=Enterococcus rivorum TaxID=762845 RepID=UPI003643F2CA
MFRLKSKRDQLSTKRQLAGSNSARNEPISFLTGVKRAVNSNKTARNSPVAFEAAYSGSMSPLYSSS